MPSADYAGESYVDSNGCIFLKAGYGGTATWNPRVGQDRKPVCGQTPTNAVAKVTDAAASDTSAAPKAHSKKHRARPTALPAPVLIGCPVSVPVARRYATTDGGSVVICTAKNGSLTGARSPIYPAGSGVGAALSANPYPGVTIPLPQAKAAAEPSTQATVAARYVQVGAFGQPSNADAASARLAALGLPVSKASISKHGQALQVIFAGPFSTGADAQAALIAARNSGFSDAYLR